MLQLTRMRVTATHAIVPIPPVCRARALTYPAPGSIATFSAFSPAKPDSARPKTLKGAELVSLVNARPPGRYHPRPLWRDRGAGTGAGLLCRLWRGRHGRRAVRHDRPSPRA